MVVSLCWHCAKDQLPPHECRWAGMTFVLVNMSTHNNIYSVHFNLIWTALQSNTMLIKLSILNPKCAINCQFVCVYVGQIESVVLHLGVTWISYSVTKCIIHPYGEYECLCVCVCVCVCICVEGKCECVFQTLINPMAISTILPEGKIVLSYQREVLFWNICHPLWWEQACLHKLLYACAPKLVNTHTHKTH